jgi:DNA mismatch endonuclease, patch repair protein
MAMTRSENMARIRSANTEPEVLLRKRLWSLGVRYRRRSSTPAGRADIAIASQRVAVYVDGCFWHGCPEHYVRPRSSTSRWEAKLIENVRRDRRQTLKLLEAGWTAIRVWEHQVRENLEATTELVLEAIRSRGPGYWPNWRVVHVSPPDDQRCELRTLEELVGTATRLERGRRQTAKVGRVVREAHC